MSFISVFNTFGGSKKYDSGQIVFEKNIAGSYQLNILQPGTFYVEMVGGGGGGANSDGGTAAVYLGNIYINSGTYTIQVGEGGKSGNRNNNAHPGTSSSISNILICGNGFPGKGNRENAPYRVNQGGDFIILNPKVVLQPENGKNGIKGSYHEYVNIPSGFLPNTAYGSGGGSAPANHSGGGNNGGGGYVKITYLRSGVIK